MLTIHNNFNQKIETLRTNFSYLGKHKKFYLIALASICCIGILYASLRGYYYYFKNKEIGFPNKQPHHSIKIDLPPPTDTQLNIPIKLIKTNGSDKASEPEIFEDKTSSLPIGAPPTSESQMLNATPQKAPGIFENEASSLPTGSSPTSEIEMLDATHQKETVKIEFSGLNPLEAHFPNKEQGKKIISQQDRFLSALSPFDMQTRMKSCTPVSLNDFLSYYTAQILPCELEKQQELKQNLEELSQQLKDLGIILPKNIQFIQTTSQEEIPGTWAYCRGNTIFFKHLGKNLLAHELFHVYSSHNPEMRKKLYQLIGYQMCPPIQLPPSLINKRIVNPDSPDLNAYITINYQGKPVQAIPIDLYDLNYKGKGKSGFLTGIYHKFAILEPLENGEMQFKLDEKGEPLLFDFEEAENLVEQIGENTSYVDSPEEILADNFAILLLGGPASSPDLIEKMKKCITGK